MYLSKSVTLFQKRGKKRLKVMPGHTAVQEMVRKQNKFDNYKAQRWSKKHLY